MQSLISHWLILFFKYFGYLKEKIKQVYPKGSIIEAYYRCRRNEDGDEHNNLVLTLYLFEVQGTASGKERSRYFTDAEYIAPAHLHVLLNCDEVKPYIG